MRALITGGSGFIGSHLAESLVRDGYQVRVVDNLKTGRLENIRHLLNKSNFDFIEADVTNRLAMMNAARDRTHIFHLAALADIVPSIEDPQIYFDTNVSGTANIVEAARLLGVQKVVYAASSSCYGIPTQFPTPETSPLNPQYPYALTKLLGEQIVMHWSKVYGFPAMSLRLFNVYGPRSRTTGAYGAVFGVFLAQKFANMPMTVVGDGSQERDFIYVDDVVSAFKSAALSGQSGLSLNVGTGTSHSINYLVELLGGKAETIPKRPGEPDLTLASIESIQQVLGWKPAMSFEDGVRLMVQRISDWSEAPVWTPESISSATAQWFSHLGSGERKA